MSSWFTIKAGHRLPASPHEFFSISASIVTPQHCCSFPRKSQKPYWDSRDEVSSSAQAGQAEHLCGFSPSSLAAGWEHKEGLFQPARCLVMGLVSPGFCTDQKQALFLERSDKFREGWGWLLTAAAFGRSVRLREPQVTDWKDDLGQRSLPCCLGLNPLTAVIGGLKQDPELEDFGSAPTWLFILP